MSKNLLCVIFVLFSAVRAFSWTDGELLVWISVDKGWRGLTELAKKFEKDLGIPVKVETPDGLTDKFQSAAQSGKGPDIVIWAHDRLGEWADAGLLKPLEIEDDFKAAFLPMTWDAVTHNKQIWGYPTRPRGHLAHLQQKDRYGYPAGPALGNPCVRQGTKSQKPQRDPDYVGLQ